MSESESRANYHDQRRVNYRLEQSSLLHVSRQSACQCGAIMIAKYRTARAITVQLETIIFVAALGQLELET